MDHYTPTMSVSIQDTRSHNSTDVTDIARTQKYKNKRFNVTYTLKSGNKKTHVNALRTGVAAVNVTAVVEEFRSISENKIFNASVIEIIEEYIMSELLTHKPFVYGMDLNPATKYDVMIICDYIEPYSCRVQLTKSLKEPQTNSSKRVLSKDRVSRLMILLEKMLKDGY